jgi:ketosteroid isomerase-like protein
MKKVEVLLFCLLLVAMCSSSAIYSQSASDYKAKIEMANKEMAKCMVDGNTEKSLSMYTSDAITMPSYAPMHDGLAAIKQASEDMVKSGMKYNSFELTTLKVMPNGNLITEIGTYKLNAKVPDMDNPIDDHGKYLTVWEKQKDGSLKVKIEIWNTDVNPMSMMK